MGTARLPKQENADRPRTVSLLRRKIIDPAKKRKVTLVLTVDTDIRLSVLAKMMDCDRSELVEEMLCRELAELQLKVKGKDYGTPPPSTGEAA